VGGDRRALPPGQRGALVLDQRRHRLAVRQPDQQLGAGALVDQPLDHAGQAVLTGRPVRLQPHPLGADHHPHLAAGAGVARGRAQVELAQAQPAAAVGGGAGGRGRHQVRHAQEAGHVGVGRFLVHLGRGADLLDAAAGHDRQPVRQGQGLLLVVGDVQEGDPDGLLERLQLHLERLAQLGVQRAERLVQQQHRRLQHQRPGQRHPLLLAAGELRRPAALEPLQPDQLQRRGDPAPGLGARHVLEAQAEGDVVVHVHEREQRVALEDGVDLALVGRGAGHVDPVEEDAAGARLLEPGDQPQGGRLAAAGGSQQGEQLAAVHLQVDAVDGGDVLEPLDQPDEPDLASAHSAPLSDGAPPRS
jgi:hypothetical protein